MTIIPNANPDLRIVEFWADESAGTYTVALVPIIGWYVRAPTQRQLDNASERIDAAEPVTFDTLSWPWVIQDATTGRAWCPGSQSFDSLADAAAELLPNLVRA